jgi:hypothetical protein
VSACQVAVAFADMHDTPTRMAAKGVLHGVVPWAKARPFLAWRLRRRWLLSFYLCMSRSAGFGINVRKGCLVLNFLVLRFAGFGINVRKGCLVLTPLICNA